MNAKNWQLGLSCCCMGRADRDVFEAYAKAGVTTMEVSLNENMYPVTDFKAVAASSKATGVDIWSLHLPFCPFKTINIAAPDKAVRDATIRLHKEGIDNAALLGAKVVVIHPSGEPNPENERAERMKYAGECLATLAEYAAQYDITVAVEDLPRTCLGNCIADIKQLISAHDRLRVCFDTNHLLFEKNVDFVKALGDKIVTLHVSDYDYLDERHWLPYEGKVNWVELVEALEEVGYAGPFMYEIHFKTPDSIRRGRDLTFADFIDNYTACVNKQIIAPIGTPDLAVCAEKAYFAEPKIKA